MSRNHGFVKIGLALSLGSMSVVGVLSWMLLTQQNGKLTWPGSQKQSHVEPLVLYCAAGVQKPVDEAAAAYLKEFGIEVQVQYGGSGDMLSKLQIAKRGDLFLAADQSYITAAREKGLLAESLPVARIRPVIAVQKGNPKHIQSLDDMLKPDVKIALSDASASIGKLTKQLLQKEGLWEKFEKKSSVTAGTVNDAATKVAVNAVHASIIWDANVKQNPKLEMVTVPKLSAAVQEVTIGVLNTCKMPYQSLQFARYLQAPEKGGALFEKHGYEGVNGDAWEKTPKLHVYSGGLNRVAIEQTVADFQEREAVAVDVKYNGCGILVTMMKAGEMPDVYFACDTQYMDQVSDRFASPQNVSETDMVLVVQKGNPHHIATLKDLTNPELKVGAAHEYNSALGKLTKDLLQSVNLYEAVKPQIKVDPPTADLLVLQMLANSLDAAIVYRANVTKVGDKLEVISLHEGRSIAVQPVAIAKESKNRYLAGRFVEALTSAESRKRFEAVAFRWRADTGKK